MATFRICLAKEWQDRLDISGIPSGPMFDIYRRDENQASACIHVLLDSSQVNTLQGEIGVQGQHIDAQIKHTVLRYAIQRIEQGIKEELLPPPASTETHNLFVEETDLFVLRQLLQEKTCVYQLQDGRDVLCSAASSQEPTLCGQVGFRVVAPTSRAICRRCLLPNTDYLCSHFLHPKVLGIVARGILKERQLQSGICDLGRTEIEKPHQCHASGNACWERVVETEEEPPPTLASPLTLPEEFDFLDTAWRLAFDKKQALLRLRSTASSASLALSCTTRSEFESRLSALADILKAMKIPDTLLSPDAQSINKDQSFNRLLACLQSRLEGVDYQAIEQAVNTLRAVNEVRVALQHSGAASRLPAELRKLGVPYPPQWGDAWDRIRAKTSEALHIIREKVLRWATEAINE